MQIKRIVLENIRSYINETIDFPLGSVLLGGHVGSGKSSLLYALDFALFGIQRSEGIQGDALLRSGTERGSVEVHFIIDHNSVVIKRIIRLGAKGVIQESGFLTINGVKKEGTALELKQAILDLLQYPPDLLTKSKGLLYRYTVYTPQEEMKSILLGDKEVRLDTLRRVFGIDRYQRVQHNGRLFVSHLKSKKKEFLGRIYDLEDKRLDFIQLETQKQNLHNDLDVLASLLIRLEDDVRNAKNALEQLEKNRQTYNDLKREFAVVDISIQENNSKLSSLEANCLKLEKELKEFEASEPIEALDILEQKKLALQKELDVAYSNEKDFLLYLQNLKIQKDHSELAKKDILHLNKCPTCKQLVKEDYKLDFSVAQDALAQELTQKIKRLEKDYGDHTVHFNQLKETHRVLLTALQKSESYSLKQKHFNEKILQQQTYQHDILNLNHTLLALRSKKEALTEELSHSVDLDREHSLAKHTLDNVLTKEKEALVDHARITSHLDQLTSRLLLLTGEISRKEEIVGKIKNLESLQTFFEEYFFNLLTVMEKQIMTRLYHEFNTLFTDWFSRLIDNDYLKVRLDLEFTPLISQNGYDLPYTHLSGGEKTACALAYRLALNQVINTLMSRVRTRDLLILDEPTDGFSYEQLDRLRDVLKELGVKQLIIVSHEPKVESFVDSVIRLEKDGHVSRVIR